MSFIRNSPVADRTGKPPAEASPMPGVVSMNDKVPRKNRTANAPPSTDNFGDQGLTANRTAAINSAVPSNR